MEEISVFSSPSTVRLFPSTACNPSDLESSTSLLFVSIRQTSLPVFSSSLASSLARLLAPTTTILFLLSLTPSTLETNPPAPPWSMTEIAIVRNTSPWTVLPPSISCWWSSRAIMEAIDAAIIPLGDTNERNIFSLIERPERRQRRNISTGRTIKSRHSTIKGP